MSPGKRSAHFPTGNDGSEPQPVLNLRLIAPLALVLAPTGTASGLTTSAAITCAPYEFVLGSTREVEVEPSSDGFMRRYKHDAGGRVVAVTHADESKEAWA